MRVRDVTMVLRGAALAIAVSACGSTNNGDNGAAEAPAAATPAVSRVVHTPAATSTSVHSVSNGSVAAANFRAELTIQSPGLALLALTNISRSTVTVQGWATLRFLAADNRVLPVTTYDVQVPGAGPSIRLKPGTTAFAGVRYALGDKGNPATFVATTVQLTPPHGTGVVNVTVIGVNGRPVEAPEFDITSVKLGSLQPVTQGVLVF